MYDGVHIGYVSPTVQVGRSGLIFNRLFLIGFDVWLSIAVCHARDLWRVLYLLARQQLHAHYEIPALQVNRWLYSVVPF